MASRFVTVLTNSLKKTYKGGSKWTLEDISLGSKVAEGTSGKKKLFFEMEPYSSYVDQSARLTKLSEASGYANGYLGSIKSSLRNLPRL